MNSSQKTTYGVINERTGEPTDKSDENDTYFMSEVVIPDNNSVSILAFIIMSSNFSPNYRFVII